MVSRASFPVHQIDAAEAPNLAGAFAVEPIKVTGTQQFEDVPHRHDFTQMIYITGGTGSHVVDFEEFPLHPPQVFVLARGQVHHWLTDGPVHGTLVIFNDPFLDALRGQPERVVELASLGSNDLHPDAPQRARIERLIEATRAEYEAHAPLNDLVLRNLLSALLVECARMAAPASRTGQSQLSRDFTRLALTSPNVQRTVTSCAHDLGVSPGHLSDVVSADTGTTPGRIIRRAVTREAQRLLSGTDLTAAQIAKQLGFVEPSYFSRFFRREAGMTPTSYRDDLARR